MKESFLSDRLRRHFGIEVIIPVQVQRQAVHRIIYEELCHGELNDSSRDVFLDVVEDLSHEVVLRSFSDVSKLSYSSTEAIRNYLCLIQQRFKRKPWLISRYVLRS